MKTERRKTASEIWGDIDDMVEGFFVRESVRRKPRKQKPETFMQKNWRALRAANLSAPNKAIAFLFLLSALTCSAVDCAWHLPPSTELDTSTDARFLVTDYQLLTGKTYIIETGNNAETWIPIGSAFTMEADAALRLKFAYFAGGSYFNRQYFRVRVVK